MGVHAKFLREIHTTKGYQPQSIPKVLKVIQGNLKENLENYERHLSAKTIILNGFNMIALKATARGHAFDLGREVRNAWQQLQQEISDNDSLLIDKDIGFVFYDKGNMLKSDGSLELFVGIKVDSFENTPSSVEKVTIPTRKYAVTTCECQGREKMNHTYNYLNDWIKKEGLEVDNSKNAFTLEPNRLTAFNPFEIPANEIQEFDFDIFYPIK